jgi:predicted Zn-dependent protease
VKRSPRTTRVVRASVLGVLLASGCAINPVTQSADISLTSKARERELGADEAKRVEAFLGLVDDEALHAYLEAVGGRLLGQLPSHDAPYRFNLIDSDVPNAFALPGGHVYVTRGLLAYLNDEDELACVLAHEIAHVAARHSMAQRTRSILTSPLTIATGLAGAATGIVAPRLGGAVASVGQLASGALLASYSREQEREADRIGMELAAAAGWSPTGMTSMLITLEREEKLVRGSLREADFLDTHPSTPERVATTKSLAAKLSVSPSGRISRERSAFLRRLENLMVGENPADGVFAGRTFLHPDQRFAMRFPADWKHHNAREAVAASEPNERAAIVMQLLGKGDDPLIAADARKKQIGFSLAGVLRKKINGLDAARVVAGVRGSAGTAALHLTWIAYDGRIYEITGLTSPALFATFRSAFADSADSFAALTEQQRRSIEATRLKILEARGGESLARLLDRAGAAWSPSVAAVANGLQEGVPLRAGQLVKAPAREPY